MSLSRRNFLGRSVAASALVVSVPANANPAHLDAELIGLGLEFTTALAAVEAAADRVERFELARLGKRMRKAEGELEHQTAVAAGVAFTILRTPARSPVGLVVKISVEEAWPGTFIKDELMTAIIADLKGMTGEAA
jgi:hypothetical protein